MRGYLSIVPVALRGSTGLYVRHDSGDRVDSSSSGSRVQGTGRGTGSPSRLRPGVTRGPGPETGLKVSRLQRVVSELARDYHP